MAVITAVSPAHSPVAALGGPPRAHGRRHDSHPGPETPEWIADEVALSRAVLQKMALEGKDFQTARREVEEGAPPPDHRPPPPPPSSPGSVAGAAMVTASVTTVDVEHVVVDLHTASTSLHVEVLNVHVATAQVSAPAPSGKKDPLLLDLDGNGASTTGSDGARAFDLAADGDLRPTSFASGGDAFLALDRNGNGRIDDGGELFGDQHGAADGFEELRKFDGNADGRIDAQDGVFGSLQLLYGDGSVGRLADAEVASISLDAASDPGTTSKGDDILRQGTALRADGSSLTAYAMALQRFDQTV